MSRKFEGRELIVATHNAGKLEEISDLLSPFGLTVTSNADHGLPEPVEDGSSFVENARIKAHAAMRATGLPALADDSGIEIEALGGMPGIWTADWAETPEGRDFVLAMRRAHDELVASGTAQPWRARFCCTLVLAWPDGHDEVYPGTLQGQIVWPMRGKHGHGYDPIFQPDGYEKTLAEMDRQEKNRLSHRADAFAKLIAGSFA